MPTLNDFPVIGHVVAAEGAFVVIKPHNTNYELQLLISGSAQSFTAGQKVHGVVRASARKVWTVPSGGNYVTPIFGPPRIVQGRVRYLNTNTMVVHAGIPIVVTLPTGPYTCDLVRGPLAVGVMANASLLPGALFELLIPAVAGA